MKNPNSNPNSPDSKSFPMKALGFVGTLLLFTGIGYLTYNLLKRKPKSVTQVAYDLTSTVKNAPSEIKAVVTGKYADCGFPLKKGCGGENVVKLQRFLNKSSDYALLEDGKFGDLTENAVIDNQMPFETWKSMYPSAIKGQVTKEFFDSYVKNA